MKKFIVSLLSFIMLVSSSAIVRAEYEYKSANVAINKTASRINTGDTPAVQSKLTDGSYSGYADMYNTKYIDIDLGEVYTVNEVKAGMQFGDASEYKIYAKLSENDEYDKVGAFTYTSSNAVKSVSSEFTDTECRYIRLEPSYNCHSVICEIEVIGKILVDTSYVSVIDTKKTAIYSSGDIYGNSDLNAFDKNEATTLTVKPDSDKNIIIDLGKNYEINRFDISYNVINWEKTAYWTVYGSQDAISWDALTVFTALTDSSDVASLYFESGSYRYIKMFSSVGSGQYLRANEIDIYGYISAILGEDGYTVPENEATNITNIGADAIEWAQIHFGQDMDISSLNPENITVTDSEGNTVSFDEENYTASLRDYKFSLAPLSSNTEYTVTIDGVKNSADEEISEIYTFSFTTGSILKGTLSSDELIERTYPENEAQDITNENEQYLVIDFKTKMDTTTLIPDNIVIYDVNGNTVEYDIYTAEEKSFKLDLGYLSSDTEYTVTVKSEVMTSEGKKLDSDYSFGFKTGRIYESNTIQSLISKKYPEKDTINVTNIEKSGIFSIKFNKEIDTESLLEALIISDASGTEIQKSLYTVTENEVKIDLSEFLDDSEYTVKLQKDKLKIKDGDRIIGDDYCYSFKTGNIIDIPAVEGKVISNIAKNKTIIGTDIAARPLKFVNDGDRSTAGEINGAAGLYTMDLGGYYDVSKIIFAPATSFDYSGSNLDYHITGLNIMTGNKGITEKDFTILATTSKVGTGQPYIIDVKENNNPIRYIGLRTSNIHAIVGDFEVYAYVDEVYTVNYSKTENSYVFDVDMTNYTSEQKEAYFLVFCSDANDKLISVKAKKVSAMSNSTDDEKIELTIQEDTKKITACVVRGLATLKHLTEPVEIVVE